MFKKVQRFASATIATALVLSGIPYNAFAASPQLGDLAKVNELTQVTVEGAKVQAKISSKINTNSNEMITVIVELQQEPVAVARHKALSTRSAFSEKSAQSNVNKAQANLEKAANQFGIQLNVGKTFNYVINAMEVTLPASDIIDLAKLPGVKAVHHNTQYAPVPVEKVEGMALPAGKYDLNPLKQIGVPDMWAAGYTGKGLKVGVIDTGVDYLHPDLKDAFKGGHDSIDNDTDPYEMPPIEPDKDIEKKGDEGSDHGTHVSGTIVGRASNNSDIQVRGVAYEADLYVYRVLGRYGGNSAQVIDGIERSVKDGMDVINLSLGADVEKNADSPDAIAVNNAVLAGVVTVMSQGNAANNRAGRHFYTVGSPASAKLPITVGAVTAPSVQYSSSAQSSFGKNYAFKVMSYQTGKDDFKALIGTNGLNVVYADLGVAQDYQGLDVKGKVALVSRGAYAFTEKINQAKKAGAVAIVIFNGNDSNGDDQADLNNPGREGYIGTVLGDQLDAIPTFDMKGAEGWELAKELIANPDKAKTLTFTFSGDYPMVEDKGDQMANFSSRGPVMDGSYGIKPDVSAPGVSILSAKPAWAKYFTGADYSKAYQRLNGTSMASPHVAGLALLLKQAHPNWTPFDIKAALANTSVRLSDAKGVEYDVYSQGAGRTDGYAALRTPALLTTVEKITLLDTDLSKRQVTNYGINASFGLMKAGEEGTKTLQLKNTSGKEVAYTTEIVMHKSVTTDPYKPVATPDTDDITVELTEDMLTVAPGKTEKFELSLSPSTDAEDGVYEGEVVLTSKDGSNPDLHLPFVVHVGDEREETHFGLDMFQLSENVVSPNGDGINDTIEAAVLLQAKDVNVVELQVWGYDDGYKGTMASVYVKDSEGNPTYDLLEPGKITFANIDGTYASGALVRSRLQDGNYKLRVLAYSVDPSAPAGENITAVYEMWKALGVTTMPSKDELTQILDTAKRQFQAEVVNTTEVGAAVLALPEGNDVLTYSVTNSNKTKYIDKNGMLIARPTATEGEQEVRLVVTIAVKDNPSMKRIALVRVTLQP